MRLMECLRLAGAGHRFDRSQIVVRRGKGDKDRVVPLPSKLVGHLRDHLSQRRELHQSDLAAGFGEVALPDALAVKYPNAAHEWRWQFVFPGDGSRSIPAAAGRDATMCTKPPYSAQ